MVRCFIHWLSLLGVKKEHLRMKLHVYTDQDEAELKKFWANTTGVSLGNFNKSYVKKTRADRKTYKGMFPYGTCVVAYHNRDMHEYVIEGVKYLRNKHLVARKL
jgi:hypothetical protein